MIMDQKRFEHIENYLTDKLSAIDKVAFEKEIGEENGLQQDVELVKLTLDTIKSDGLSEKLTSIHEELYPSHTKNKSGKSWIYISGIAASILLMMLFWFSTENKPYGNEELFIKYFQPFPDYVTARNAELNKAEEAFLNYSKGEFGEAVQLFEKFDIQNEDIKFYLALSYLGDKNVPKAVDVLAELALEESKYLEQVHWYLSLAYLKQNENKKAIEMLMSIKTGDYQFKNAKQLLESLEVKN